MLRRALLTILPALLALVFVGGTPGTGVADAGASTWNVPANITIARHLTARGVLTEDDSGVPINQSADEDDVPDNRIVRLFTPIVWPATRWAPIRPVSDGVGPSHPPRAHPSRAPPTA